jgi:hypothetical protein
MTGFARQSAMSLATFSACSVDLADQVIDGSSTQEAEHEDAQKHREGVDSSISTFIPTFPWLSFNRLTQNISDAADACPYKE